MIDTKTYGDTIMINTRNATDIQIIEGESLTKEEIRKEFTTGDISKIEQDRVYEKLDDELEIRKRYLELKSASMKNLISQ